MKGTGGDPGWYFVLQERPGEARFGLEVSRTAAIETFDRDRSSAVFGGLTLYQGGIQSLHSSTGLH